MNSSIQQNQELKGRASLSSVFAWEAPVWRMSHMIDIWDGYRDTGTYIYGVKVAQCVKVMISDLYH